MLVHDLTLKYLVQLSNRIFSLMNNLSNVLQLSLAIQRGIIFPYVVTSNLTSTIEKFGWLDSGPNLVKLLG